ncbi:MAG: NAD(P)/FAD-dependent oxidoreductase [Methanomassiliicoccus sp.]|nr:NAD(P)/FAD-dependent oxidoreductase [Methanomassiliicoccus sp.]
MNTDFDVVIVGSGPAGSSTAEHAALGGARVLVLERKKVVGEPVACGEFMPMVEEIKDSFPRAEDLDPVFDIPQEYISREMDLFRIVSPTGHFFDVPFRGYTTDRDRFDKYLASKAVKAGAVIKTASQVTSVKEGEVSTRDETYRARVVVGADGPISKVAMGLGLPRNADLYPAVTSQAIGDFEPVMEMHFGGLAPGAYAWVLPKKHGANVGVGVAPRFSGGRVGDYFQEFLEQRHLEVKGRPFGKYVPSNGPLRQTCTASGLLVGDAAGHVMAVNGGGIPIAMICGRIAGRSIADHLRDGTPLTRYEESWKRQVYKPLRTAVHTKMLASLFFGGPRRLEFSMRFLGERRMGNILRCRPSFP